MKPHSRSRVAVDASTLSTMTDAQYRSYLADTELIYVDAHGTLRSAACVLATTREQFDVLVDQLCELRGRMEPRVLG